VATIAIGQRRKRLIIQACTRVQRERFQFDQLADLLEHFGLNAPRKRHMTAQPLQPLEPLQRGIRGHFGVVGRVVHPDLLDLVQGTDDVHRVLIHGCASQRDRADGPVLPVAVTYQLRVLIPQLGERLLARSRIGLRG
jgi:hypothetical protein